MGVMKLIAVMLAATLVGCSSAPVTRPVEAVYRFENLRKDAEPAKGRVSRDEWASIRPILEKASTRKIEVSRTGVRAFGSIELANYECRCVLGSLAEMQRIQAELDALAARSDDAGNRMETRLSQVAATYKSNFVLASVSVGVGGATVAGNRVRIFAVPGEPPVQTYANSSGIWTAKISIVPQSTWIYGVSEDVAGRAPSQYFRINAATRKQERVEEAEFLKLFPPGGDGGAPQTSGGRRPEAQRPASGPARPADESTRRREEREREDEAFRKRRAEEERRLRPVGSP